MNFKRFGEFECSSGDILPGAGCVLVGVSFAWTAQQYLCVFDFEPADLAGGLVEEGVVCAAGSGHLVLDLAAATFESTFH